MYSFLAGHTCNPYTPVQSKPTFYISGLEVKKTAKWPEKPFQNVDKCCQKAPQSDTKPSKRLSANMFQSALTSHHKKNKICLQSASKRYPKKTLKSSTNLRKMTLVASLHPSWHHHPTQGAPESQFSHFGTHFGYFGGWLSCLKTWKQCHLSPAYL